MGILDEAIREHLDLKRRHGAQDSEVKRLEDEAFGLPTRPGEPDFPESEEQPAADAAAAAPAPTEPEVAVPEPDSSAIEHPVVEAEAATVKEPTPEPEQEPEPEPGSEEATLLHDQTGSGPSAPEEAQEALLDEAQLEEPAPARDERSIAAEETVEHPMEELLGDEPAPGPEPAPGAGEPAPPATEPAATEPEPAVEPEPAAEPAPGEDLEPAEGEPEDADVLEETPEFLRDQPEDDELWFEQGQPKDFDF